MVTEKMADRMACRNQKKLRCGYTTGSCAAAAAKAAVRMLLSGEEVREVRLLTPKGVELYLEVEDCRRSSEAVSCAIRKDAGDDPDVTNGILVYAKVRKSGGTEIRIDGGAGVGRVTKPGLEQPVGAAAINKVPRTMIQKEVKEVCSRHRYEGGLQITIEIPGGEQLAGKTFNPRLGIAGGLSVLGTSGIVEPMSEKALTDTIRLELKVLRANHAAYCLAVPGNYGSDFLKKSSNLSVEQAVKCSNYIGETIDYAAELGYQGILLVGHVGKFIKLAAGIMNTHSKQADARMEIVASHAAMHGADQKTVCAIMESVTTAEALRILKHTQVWVQTLESIMRNIEFHIRNRAGASLQAGVLMFSEEEGILGRTTSADWLMERLEEQMAEMKQAEEKR